MLIALVLVLNVIATKANQCSPEIKCDCSNQLQGGIMVNRINCRDLGDREQLPEFYARVEGKAVDVLRIYRNSRIRKIQKEAVKGLYLKDLKLSNLQIHEVDVAAFNGAKETLKEIYLGQNRLTKIHSLTFQGLGKLQSLSLESNNITKLNSDAFKNAVSLQQLSLGGNQLQVIHKDLFEDLTELRELGLQDNQIGELPSEVFKGKTKIYAIDLSSNAISELKDSLFQAQKQLGLIYMFRLFNILTAVYLLISRSLKTNK